MIESIRGKLIETSPTFCLVDCHGIGIGLHISVQTYQQIQKNTTDQISLLTHLYVREDVLQLYGFSNSKEKQVFRLLISVSGVGPRMALAILSGIAPDELEQAIAMNDVTLLTKIPGVGKKTAQRLILELKEKITAAHKEEFIPGAVSASREESEKIQEAVLALVALGFRQAEAQKTVNKLIARKGIQLPVEELIKLALREL